MTYAGQLPKDKEEYSSRPEGLIQYQKEMYEIEDTLRKRLLQLGYVYKRQ